MKQKLALAVPVLTMILLSACSTTPEIPTAALPALEKGDHLVSHAGDRLFVYRKDASGQSNCVRDCLKVFRPMFSAPDDRAVGNFTRIERPDGMSQWAYKGAPLYVCPVPDVASDAPAKIAQAAARKAEACAKAAGGDWVAAKP